MNKMRGSRGRYTNIQDGPSHSSFTGIWNPEGNEFGHSGGGNNRYSYQSIRSTGSSATPPTSTGRFGTGTRSIRNSAYSNSTAWGYRQLRWCVTCYESKFVTIEPVLFVVMFSVYLHKILSELYIFNEFAGRVLESHENYTRINHIHNTSCISTPTLNNVTYVEEVYEVDLPWSNKTGDVVEKDAGILFMILNVVLGAFSILGTLMLGPLSNRFGRKVLLLVILSGLVLQALITVLVTRLEFNVHYLILGAALRGVTGGVAAVYTVSYSYIMEFNQDKKKHLMVRIGVIEALSFVAVSLGLTLGGVAVDELKCNFSIPAFVVLGCIVCVFLYTAIATSDTRHREYAFSTSQSANHTPPPQKEKKVHVSPTALLQGAKMFFKSGYPRSKLWFSLIVMVVTIFNSSGVTAIITLFLLHEPLAFSPLLIGGYLGMSEFIHGLVLVVVLPLLLSARVHDGTIVTLSIMVTMATNIILAFVNQGWQVFVGELVWVSPGHF
jgi:MFS family permease